MKWIERDGWEEIYGRECWITLEPRPAYCDRGNYYAKLFPDPGSKLALSIDYQDGWPRYYFNHDYAKAEIEAWLVKRGQVKHEPTQTARRD